MSNVASLPAGLVIQGDRFVSALRLLREMTGADKKSIKYYLFKIRLLVVLNRLHAAMSTLEKARITFTDNLGCLVMLIRLERELGLPHNLDPIDRLRSLESPQNLSTHNRFLNGAVLFRKPPQPDAKPNIFVSGGARSGTTACGTLLNLHPDIAILVERYDTMLGYHPNMFSMEKVYSQLEDRPHRKQYETIKEKFARARYVGDKRPGFMFGWDITAENYSPENIRVVHIIRDIENVAWSYEQRRQKAIAGEDKRWAKNRGVLAACRDLNLSNKILLSVLKAQKFFDSFFIVEYERIFSDLGYVNRLFSLLNLDFDKTTEAAVNSFLNESKKHFKKERVLSPVARAIITRVYDDRLHQKIVEQSRLRMDAITT